MGKGIWTYAAIAAEVGISEPTVKRDMNHPYAFEYVEKLQERRGALADQLIKRQIDQIERGDVKPHLQLLYRGRMIDGLLPKKIIQRVGGKVEAEIGVKIPELTAEDIARYTPVIFKAVLDAEIGAANADDDPEDSKESVDRVGASSEDRSEGPKP